MMQTAPFPGRLTTSVADGDSLRYYPAYDVPSLAALPPQAAGRRGEPARSCCWCSASTAALTIGDTHEYDEPFAFDVDEDAYDHLLARAEALLGAPAAARCSAAGPASTARSTGTPALYHRSEPSCPAWSWSPARAGAA